LTLTDIRERMKDILNEIEAADYLHLTPTYMKSLRRMKKGPRYVKPTYRVVLYHVTDLDAWEASWQTIGPQKEI
jgi:hypothetical protein